MKDTKSEVCTCNRKYHHGAGSNAVYGLGMIGALVYYLQNADTFGTVVVGILKAIVWPGFLVYEVLKYLHM